MLSNNCTLVNLNKSAGSLVGAKVMNLPGRDSVLTDDWAHVLQRIELTVLNFEVGKPVHS